MEHPLVTQVRATCLADDLLPSGEEIIVAVSGGQDSVAMLHALAMLREEFNIRLCAAHFDHMLRGAASAADAEHVAHLAASLGVPLRMGRTDIREVARHQHVSIHEAARAERHAFLKACAQERGACAVAYGHTSDDVVETMLLNLFRGCSPDGLAPLPPRAGLRVRPLIHVCRSATARYCREMGLTVRTDSSNSDLRYTRSRVRGELLPQVEAYMNPAARDAMLRLAQFIREDEDTLGRLAEEATQAHLRRDGDASVSLDGAVLLDLEPSVRRRTAMRMMEHLDIDLSACAWAVREALHAVEMGLLGSWTLPGGARLEVRRDGLRATSAVRTPQTTGFGQCVPIGGAVLLPFGIGVLRTELRRLDEPPSHVERFRAVVPVARIVGSLHVRPCRTDDRFSPLGMGATTRAWRYLAGRKVPRDERERTLLVSDEAGPLWVVGHGIDERARADAAMIDAVVLTVEDMLGPGEQQVCHTNMPYQKPLEA